MIIPCDKDKCKEHTTGNESNCVVYCTQYGVTQCSCYKPLHIDLEEELRIISMSSEPKYIIRELVYEIEALKIEVKQLQGRE